MARLLFCNFMSVIKQMKQATVADFCSILDLDYFSMVNPASSCTPVYALGTKITLRTQSAKNLAHLNSFDLTLSSYILLNDNSLLFSR